MSFFSEWLSPKSAFIAKPTGPSRALAEKQLLHRCRGDREQVERLIQLEITRRASLSRADAAAAALDRWSRDR